LQQSGDESLPALLSRVTRVVDRLHRNQQRVSTAWLLLNRCSDEAAVAARIEIARAVAGAIARGGRGLMVLVMDAAEEAGSLAATFALVDRLLEFRTVVAITVGWSSSSSTTRTRSRSPSSGLASGTWMSPRAHANDEPRLPSALTRRAERRNEGGSPVAHWLRRRAGP